MTQRAPIVVTGAGAGVGLACALAFASAGATLVLCDDDSHSLQAAARRTGALARFCDVASEASVDIVSAEIADRFGSVAMLVNAAGSGYLRSLGMMRMSRALLPALRSGSGSKLIANVAPPPCFAARAGLFPYAASHDAFVRLSEAIGLQTRGSSVATVTILPPTAFQHLARQPESQVEARLVTVDRLDPDAVAATIVGLSQERLAPAASPTRRHAIRTSR